jgi:tetratricopeptide (TPR) repeat protein
LQLYDEALTVSRANFDLLGQGSALGGKGSLKSLAGRYDEARSAYKDASELFRLGGNHTEEGHALMALGELENALGNKEAAKQLLNDARSAYQKAVALSQQKGNQTQEAEAVMALGNVEKALGNADAARQAFRNAASTYAELGLIPYRDFALAAAADL